MNHPLVRMAAAVVFLAVWAAPIVLNETDTEGISTQPPWEIISLLGLYGGVGVAAGFLTRLPALLLPPVLLLAVLPLGDGGGEIPLEVGVVMYSIILAYPAIALGLLARLAFERLCRSDSAVDATAT